MEIITPPSILEHDLRQLRIKQSQLDIFLPQLVETIEKQNRTISTLKDEIDQMKTEIREIKGRK